MTPEQLKTQIDTDITNKTSAKSITPTNVGKNMKDVVDFIPDVTGKENISNKSINIITDATSDIKYPSVKSVKTQLDLKVDKVISKSLVLDTEITKLSHLNDTTDLQKPVSTAQQAAIDAAVQAQISDSTALLDPTIPIVPTGNVHILGVGPGTYAFWGGLVVPANNTATLRRVSGAFSMSLTPVDLSFKVNVSDIVDNLTSTDTAKPLSAKQGKLLNEKFNNLPYFDEIFEVGKNKFNKNLELLDTYWISNSDGSLYIQGAGFKTTNYQPISSGNNTLSGWMSMSSGLGYSYRIVDENLELVSHALFTDLVTIITVPAGKHYIQFCYGRPGSELNGLRVQIEEGSSATAYEPYFLNTLDDISVTTILPATINVAVGRQCNIYKDNLSDVIPDRDTLYSKDFTKFTDDSEFLDLERNARFSPTSVKSLNTNLKIKNTKKELQYTKNIGFNAVSKTAGSGTKNILFIGDSLTAYGAISGEVKNLFDADGGAVCNLIGRIGTGSNKYEARGGWSMSNYASNQKKRHYLIITGFPTTLDMVHQYVEISGSYYRIDKWSLDGSGNGTLELTFDSGTETIAASGNLRYTGTGDTNYSYTYTGNDVSGNPFWNINSSVWNPSPYLDFWTYMQNYHSGVSLDVVIVQHGINDLWGCDDSYIPTFKTYAQRIRDVLHTQYPTCKVIFSLEPFAPYSDGYSGLRGVVELDAYKKIMFKGYNALIELVDANTTIAYSNLWIDRLYGYGAVTRNVNSRSLLQITENSGGTFDVHPSTEGSNQIADCIYSQIRAVI